VLPLIDEAGRDVSRLVSGAAGALRIAVECHTCFDWLMPAMDALRERWPEAGCLECGYVASQRIGPQGLTGRLHAAVPERLAARPYVADFVRVMRETSLRTLPGVRLM
jgi:hypothetical protein